MLAIVASIDVLTTLIIGLFIEKTTKPICKQDKTPRILVIRIDHKIGDMVIFSSFVRQLRSIYPNAWIDLVIHTSAAQLYKYCPYVDRITVFDWGQSLQLSLLNRITRAYRFIKNKFDNEHFDLVYVPRWDIDHHAKFIAYFSGGIKRISYSRKVSAEKKMLEFGFDTLMTESIIDPISRHEAERSLFLLSDGDNFCPSQESARPEIWLTPEDHNFSELELVSWKPRDTIALGPGAAADKRRWPKERFAEFAKHFSDRYTLILLGSSEDYELCEYIRDFVGLNCINYAGKTSIRQSAALLQKCKLFVGNDSGLLHLAAASAVACIEISCHPMLGDKMHPNSPTRFGPLSLNSFVCQPETTTTPCKNFCNSKDAHCILQVSVELVVSKATSLLMKLQENIKVKEINGC